VVSFLSGLATIANHTETKVIPVTKTFYHYIEEGVFNSDREAINWLNDELKENTSQQLSKNFRIVTKNDLIVRERKTINAKIKGQLNHGDIVQIIEKKRNWTYVHFSNYEDSKIVEGWVFTRYLKQIR